MQWFIRISGTIIAKSITQDCIKLQGWTRQWASYYEASVTVSAVKYILPCR